MALILCIETSTEVCSVALYRKNKFLEQIKVCQPKSHAKLLPAIAIDLLKNQHINFQDLDAVAVSEGPGSYTGLRIGITTAKGFCYAHSIPLIAVPTLDILIENIKFQPMDMKGKYYLCPMLDARRMEVYTKMVDEKGGIIWDSQPKILDKQSFQKLIKPTYLFGNGMPKFRTVVQQKKMIFIDDIVPEAKYMGNYAYIKYLSSSFEDVAYFEPNYLKVWQTNQPKNKGMSWVSENKV